LTYTEAAERLGLTPEAVRALARRQHWPRRSPNAVGGQTWILVPASRLEAAAAGGHADSGRRTGRRDDRDESILAAGQNSDGQRIPADTGEHIVRRTPADTEDTDRRLDEILAAVRGVPETLAQITRDALTEVSKDVVVALQEAITSLRVELCAQRDRADAAEKQLAEVRAQLVRRWWRWRR
jgi:hypothetical protein